MLTRAFWLSFNTVRRTWRRSARNVRDGYWTLESSLRDGRRAARRKLVEIYIETDRLWRRAKKETKRLKRRVYHRGRYTSAGRAMLAVSEAATSPREAVRRRAVARAYTRQHPNARLDRQNGFAMLSPDDLPGVDAIIDLSRRLFEDKQRQLEEAAGPNSAMHAKKWAFMRSVLSNQDLAQHPELVDFALSDGLLSPVTHYLGFVPHLNRIDLLYSVAHGGDEAISSQMYHLDPEGLRQAKLFLNLRDVGPDEGPFTFIPALETQRIVKAVKQQRPPESEMVMARFLDSELEAVGGLEKAISVMGPVGSAGLVDTSRCLHFGSRVKPGTYRLCLYIQYCGSREHGNMFDPSRYAADPVRYLATINSRRAGAAAVAAPHQMG